jgi:hypothetical protein
MREFRARMRDSVPETEAREGSSLAFWAVAAGAVVVGFGVVLFVPRFYSIQRTSSLPVFQQEVRVETAPVTAGPRPEMPVLGNAERYKGKNVEQMGRIADGVCAQFVQASQVPPAQAEVAMLSCRLTEAPPRYCSGGQRQKIAADIINYFRGLEQANATLAANKVATKIEPDARVIEGIEGLMRLGYLMRPQRDDIGANVPRAYREQFGRVVGNLVVCVEKKPWWQVWK